MDQDQNIYALPQENVEGLNSYIVKVFRWMFIALAVTALVAFAISSNLEIIYSLVSNPILLLGIIAAELILVVVLTRRLMKLSFQAAIALFLGYAALNGLLFGIILMAYTEESITQTFLITCLTFGVMAVYGRFTKTDLTRFRNILYMGLFGVIILSLVNIFFASSQLGWIISIVGLFVFLGLTAYDMQKLKAYYYGTEGDEATRSKLSIYGALQLYLDFINLFLMLLRIFGRRN
jgi:hypothetical protein